MFDFRFSIERCPLHVVATALCGRKRAWIAGDASYADAAASLQQACARGETEMAL